MTVFENTDLSLRPISGQSPIAEAPATPLKLRRHLLRPALDAGIAMTFFAVASMTLASAPSSASPGVNLGIVRFAPSQAASIATQTQTQLFQPANVSTAMIKVDVGSRRLSQHAEWLLLGLAFSLLVAMNLAFFRHLRHAYADPRKREMSKS